MRKKCIFVVPALAIGLCSLFTPKSLNAQSENGQSEKAVQKLGQLATQLALTPEQKGQLMPILVAEAPKVQAIKTDSTLTRIQKVQRLKALHDETDPQVKAILTPEQYQQLQTIRRQELTQIIEKKRNQ
jgi:Spy/CpxP family protein refolding chaperone